MTYERLNTTKGGDDNREDIPGDVLVEDKERDRLHEELKSQYNDLENWGNLILGSTGWHFVIDPSIPTAKADFNNKTIYFGTSIESIIRDKDKLLEERKRIFFFSHELMHFAQALQCPEKYMDSFKDSRERASYYADKYGLEKAGLEKVFNRFYNAFHDIDDNGKVIDRNKTLQDERGTEAIYDTYRKLFVGLENDDFTSEPRYKQFTSYALVKMMEPDREMIVSDQIKSLFDEPFTYLGSTYPSLLDYINKKIFSPKEGTKISFSRIKSAMLPIFEKLLVEDIEKSDYQPPKESAGDIDDGIGEGVIEDFIKRYKESDENQSPEERAKKKAKNDLEKKLKKEGFNKKEVERIEQIMKSTSEVWKSMTDVWERFFARSTDYVSHHESGYHSGSLSVPQAIKELPHMLSNPSKAKPFERLVSEEKAERWRPLKISLIFTTDLSGSMNQNNKREAVQEAYYAISKSFIHFLRNQITKNDDDKSPVDAYIRNIGFGSSRQDLLKLEKREKTDRSLDLTSTTLDRRVWESVMSIGKLDLQGNDDPTYLYDLKEEAHKSSEKRSNGDEVMVVIELTDGDPDAYVAKEAKRVVRSLNNQKNIYCRSVRIGGESSLFEDIWGGNGESLPDSDVSNLKEVFVSLLEDVFNNAIK